MTTRGTTPEVNCRTLEHVLVIDDDQGIGECVNLLLSRLGYLCVVTQQGREGLAAIESREFDLVITDLRLPDASGLDIVARSKAAHPETPVILMTSFSSIESAIEALRRGANDYIIKPFDNDDFLFSVERALRERRTRMENAALKRSLRKAFPRHTIVGESEPVKRLRAIIQRVAATEANVLIQGESGTGKELVAQAIHFGGPRAHRPFVAVNCGAIPSELIESELFGHGKGAFTGATSSSEGLIREASGGTLFLDEISEMPLNVQVKLLRVLQERQVRPLGSSQSYITDTRFLAASNRNLKESAESGAFRTDLFYRLNVITIQVPPLRERGQDILLLAQHFMEHFRRKFDSRVTGMDSDFIDFLCRHPWPGNVRELQNVIERAVVLADGEVLTRNDLDEIVSVPAVEMPRPKLGGIPLSIEDYTKEIIRLYQDEYGEAELAAILGVGRKALWVRRHQWGLFRQRDRTGPGPEALHANDDERTSGKVRD
ncbi:MAG: sigma-54-dependent Fis family transcriptional regulator [Burkholderiales bacterium]|nr:sigma-54 dependent transcriptional regulator [Burkholderiales bacterium]MDE1929082.1 sigma-54-dependent Fis family transcriptional regulator [Burkholderiales bacterium]MDE2157880.1 sigma-54-dependent Fis family transcriptional regulator [Burkholderiales bacterium]MDE2505093.1 sigma-54-dependent Fis family transcriptional regulator [Burkholderiales bacterium]